MKTSISKQQKGYVHEGWEDIILDVIALLFVILLFFTSSHLVAFEIHKQPSELPSLIQGYYAAVYFESNCFIN
ncbi:hypothetical protein SAMN05443550_101183 [Pedobacter hartonius]|uniref:Uncharacterized protein n=1 Tax=Pedobacter hartonius TaxID=425514 RepID=A0A1H3WBK4_9SPHI|nr:hypothetical protein SAMN05443550_101183 [Pedobacter hartonius]